MIFLSDENHSVMRKTQFCIHQAYLDVISGDIEAREGAEAHPDALQQTV